MAAIFPKTGSPASVISTDEVKFPTPLVISGTSAADVLNGGLGNDTLDGSYGRDTVYYQRAEVGIVVDL